MMPRQCGAGHRLELAAVIGPPAAICYAESAGTAQTRVLMRTNIPQAASKRLRNQPDVISRQLSLAQNLVGPFDQSDQIRRGNKLGIFAFEISVADRTDP
jgi:hypothetical protein